MHSTSSMLGAVKMEGHEHTDWSNYYGEPEVRKGAGVPPPPAPARPGPGRGPPRPCQPRDKINFGIKSRAGAGCLLRAGLRRARAGARRQRGWGGPGGGGAGQRGAAGRPFGYSPPRLSPRYFSRSGRGCPFPFLQPLQDGSADPAAIPSLF